MKKSINLFVLVLVTNMAIHAQSNMAAASPKKETAGYLNQKAPGYTNAEHAIAPGIQEKLTRNFLRNNLHAVNIRWFAGENGYVAFFEKDGNEGMSSYDSKGRFVYSILTSGQESLPGSIKWSLVNKYGKEFRVTCTQEIKTKGKKIYIVHMTDGKLWQNVRVCNGEMDVIESYPAS